MGKWSESGHAKAFEVLASDRAKEVAKEKGIEDPQKADACLKCHVTGHGKPAEEFASGFKAEMGVQCESCHGPGDQHMKDRVKAAAIGSPGGWPIVPAASYKEKSLRYPIGVADLRSVTGKEMDLKALRGVPMFVFLGDKDDNDSVAFDDSYDMEDRELIMPLLGQKPLDRWDAAREMYKSAGLNAEFKLYPGIGHTITLEMRNDILAFLKRHAGN